MKEKTGSGIVAGSSPGTAGSGVQAFASGHRNLRVFCKRSSRPRPVFCDTGRIVVFWKTPFFESPVKGRFEQCVSASRFFPEFFFFFMDMLNPFYFPAGNA
jgi:hypothetical protein